MSAPAQDPAVEDITQKTKEVYLEYVKTSMHAWQWFAN